MSILKGQLLIFLIIYISESSGVIDDASEADEKILKLYSALEESNLTCSSHLGTVSDLFCNDAKVYAGIKDHMYGIHVILREMENSINSQMKDILVKIVRSAAVVYKSVDTMEIFISRIADNYKIFYQTIVEYGYIPLRSLNNLTTSVFPEIESNIEIIRKIMNDPREMLSGESSLIAAISDYAKAHRDEICNIYQSIDEILLYVYRIAIIAEIKTSFMVPFANLQQYRNNQDWKLMNTIALVQFQWYLRNYGRIMRQHLNLTTDLYMRACDPLNDPWISDKNYYELYKMEQTIILRYQPTNCEPEFCQDMWQKKTAQCDARYYDKRSGCLNTPTDCKNLGAVQTCVLKNGPKKLLYINSTISGFFGSNSKCPEDDGYIIDNGKGSDSAYATCGCQCHENHNKISLMVMACGVYSNEVITGVRFKRKKDILHIQPRVGKLMPYGNIQRFSERWLEIPNNIDASQIHSVEKKNSIFFLEDVLLPPKFALTGVKFVEVRKATVRGLAIEIFGASFDYRSGELDHNRRIQISSLHDNPGQPLQFFPMSSIETRNHNIVMSADRKYVELKQSLSRNDSVHSMLPLFDAIPVGTDPPRALGGVGIFHKSVELYAGFIALKIYGISYAPYFENMTSDKIEG